MKKVFVQSFGCRASQADGAAIQASLESNGYEAAHAITEADLIVVNTSATVAAAVPVEDGSGLLLHYSTRLPGDLHLVELRRGGAPYPGGHPGATLPLPGGATAVLLGRFGTSERLWVATLVLPAGAG